MQTDKEECSGSYGSQVGGQVRSFRKIIQEMYPRVIQETYA